MTEAGAMYRVSARCTDCHADTRGWIVGRDGTDPMDLVNVLCHGWEAMHAGHRQVVLASVDVEFDQPDRPQLPGTAYLVLTSGSGQVIFQRVLPELGDVTAPADLAEVIDRQLAPMNLVVLDGETHEPRPSVFGLACQLRPTTVHRPPSTP